jgi:basic amino acid/polyamine antiporter, APA family
MDLMMLESSTERSDEGPIAAEVERMPAEFGLAMATFVVVASMVGTGVLTTSGYTVASVGSNTWMLLLWVLGGITAVCGALTLAELSASMPRTGGDYVYLHEAYGPLPAFLSGWVSFVIGFAAPSAASAFGMAKYILVPFRFPPDQAMIWQRGLGTIAILAFAAIHVSGRRQTSKVQTWITAIKIALLVAFAAAGLAVGWPRAANLVDPKPLDGTLTLTLLSSLIYIYYAYTGWNAAAYMAGEVREPQKLLPRAVLLGTGGVLLLYLALNVVYALALSAHDVDAIVEQHRQELRHTLAGPDLSAAEVDAISQQRAAEAVAPIAQIAAERLFGRRWSDPLSIAIGLMLLSSLSAYLLIGPRVLFAMAQAGQFPSVAARLTPKANTPAVATVFQIVLALVLLWVGTLRSIIEYAGIGLSIFSMLAMSSIYLLRRNRPDMPRPFRTPGYPVTPAVYLGLTALVTIAAFWQNPVVSSYAVMSILAGVPVYYLWQYAKRSD